jgi:LysR family positive regulator for ilvC
MDFHELEAFIALADTFHFARAAAQVHLSPSALSRLLGRLEEELGVTLFERDTRQVSLTAEGETFLSFARETIHRRDDLRLKLSERDDQLRGILRIYASVTACYSILPPLIETLSKEHPALRLSVETGDPAGAAEAVREGRAELGLDAIPPNGYRDLECHSVRKTPLVFVSSRSGAYGKLPLAEESRSAADGSFRLGASPVPKSEPLESVLQSVPLVLPKTGLSRDRFDRWSRIHGVKPEIAAETAGNEAVLALARLGLGLGLVPRLVLENGPFADGLVLYGAGPEFGDYDIGFVQKPSVTGTDSARRLRSELARIIRATYPAT